MSPVRAGIIAVLSVVALALTGCGSENSSSQGNTVSTAASPAESSVASSDATRETANEDVQLTVMGAASTRVINDKLSELSGYDLEFVNAGSSTLVQQLADGAPGDVLITADEKNMDNAVENGSVEAPQVVATNSMVMVVPKGNPAGIQSVEDLEGDVNLVLCDPQVPCGTVSETLIEANGLDVNPVSLEHSVSDTLGKVTSGEADAGWVYRTDASAAGDQVEVIDIPHAEEHPNSLVAAITTNTEDPKHAQQLFELLISPEMADAWAEYGFTPAN